ncbi:FtsK/SpoIIIE family DNA translocase [Dongia sedimenti]|uniref:DNA translocase FtsK n=1 Tax=Dongia sedimenti TaxID=3064282 RepID=A0ABU0YQ32_9PROT|nr:DNA translocase FtsK 4TM domain-containing protein [Rhodospirillaceae bacterium R-7]
MSLLSRAEGTGGQSLLDFLRRRTMEAVGVALLLLGLAYLMALLSADSSDPSFNHAVDSPARNLLGLPGAYLADFALQALGLAAAVPAAALIAWGWRLIRTRAMARWWLKLLLLPVATALTAIPLSSLPATGQWPWVAGFGGFVGRMGFAGADGNSGLVGLAGRLAGDLPGTEVHALLILATTALTFVALFFTLGIALGGYVRFGRGVAHAGKKVGLAFDRRRQEPAVASRRVRAEEEDEERESFFRRTFGEIRLPSVKSLFALRGRRDDEDAGARREPQLGGYEEPEIDLPEPGVIERPGAARVVVAPTPKKEKKPAKKERVQAKLDFEGETEFELPPHDILARPVSNAAVQRINEESLEKNARLLETVLDDFGVKGQIVKVRPGPVVTLYELEPAPGTKTSRVVGLADDVARSMSAISVRIAVVTGRSVIGIELPNREREVVSLRELLEDDSYTGTGTKLGLALGKDIGGQPIVVDLARMPHLLIAGTTGSGKSVAINTMIMSLLYRMTPEQCKFIMIDPKMLELSVYDGIPHLLSPVVTEPKKAIVALKWVVREMENRYRSMSKLGVRNVEGYNQRLAQALAAGEQLMRRVQTGFDPETGQPIYEEEPFDLKPLPFIVVVVDEMADLMLVAGKEIEAAIQRLAQMARAAGIHIIMATQRPSVDVITGTIKANFPTRVSFHVTTRIDSRTILGEPGAEQLLGQGDMLYMANGGRITRVHGPFVSDREVESVVKFLKAQGSPDYIEDVTAEEEELDEEALPGEGGGSGDELYDKAVALVCRERKASTSFVQRYLQIGYNRAARLIERMEKEGVVSQANHAGKREVLARNIDGMD